MSSKIEFNSEATEKLRKGVNTLADAVKVTMGPSGLNVIVAHEGRIPHSTKDGVTVARNIFLEDEFERIGADMIKDVAINALERAGDGTSCSVVLSSEIINQGIKNVAAGCNPMDLKRGIDKAVEAVLKGLKAQSQLVGDDTTKIQQVASISANNDDVIGSLIADAMSKVGNEGVINVQEAKGTETIVRVVEGMKFERGYMSPYFVTDQEKMISELENPYILLTDKKINSVQEILTLLERVSREGRPLLIIADDVTGDALATLVVNKARGSLNVVSVKAPSFGEDRVNIMGDIACITGANIIDEASGLELNQVSLEQLGSCEKVVINKSRTTIIGGSGDKEKIKERESQIKSQLKECEDKVDEKFLKDRLSSMSGGVAVIYVGAASETEMLEKKDRLDDALSATKAAVEEGVVIGGGCALLKCIPLLDDVDVLNEDERIGVGIIRKAISAPFKQIVENSGADTSMIMSKVMDSKKKNFGYNARTRVLTDLIKDGVIDPTKVPRVALESASSLAGIFLTTKCVVSNTEK